MRRLNGNQAKLNTFTLPLSVITKDKKIEAVVVDVEYRYEYIDGKRSDVVSESRIKVTDTESFCQFELSISGKSVITPEFLEKSTSAVFVEIDTTQCSLQLSKIEFGVVFFKITTPDLTIVNS